MSNNCNKDDQSYALVTSNNAFAIALLGALCRRYATNALLTYEITVKMAALCMGRHFSLETTGGGGGNMNV